MSAMSSPSRQMSWQNGRERVSVLAALAIKKETVSKRLVQIRDDLADPDTGKALSQEDAAARVGVRGRTWQRWESGETVPYPRNLSAIADEFGFDVSEFFDDERATHTTPNLMGPTQLQRIEDKLERLASYLGLDLKAEESADEAGRFLQAFREVRDVPARDSSEQ